jgi:hypothetical protein
LRYASPSQISNAIFYDQTSNLSLNKSEMYQTTTQSFYTPPKAKIQELISKTMDSREQTGYYSPSKHMMGHSERQRSQASRSPKSEFGESRSQRNHNKSMSKSTASKKMSAKKPVGLPPRYVSPMKKPKEDTVNDNVSVA